MRDDIIQNILRSYFGRVFPIASVSAGQRLLENIDSLLIYVGSETDDEYEKFYMVMENYNFDQILVAQIENPAVAKELVIPRKDKIVLYTSYNDNIIHFKGDIGIEALTVFVSLYKKPPITKFSFYDMQMFFS